MASSYIEQMRALQLPANIAKPYDAGPIIDVRGALAQNGHGDPVLLWRRSARTGLAVMEIAGGHADLIVEPNGQFGAAQLDRGLANL